MEFDWVRLSLFDSVDFDRVRLVGFGSVSLAQRCSEFDGGMDLFQLRFVQSEKRKTQKRKAKNQPRISVLPVPSKRSRKTGAC